MKRLAAVFAVLGLGVLLASCASSGAGVAQNPTTPGSAFRDCADCPEMVVIPAGRFVMGSATSEPVRDMDEGPQREVTIGSPIAVSRFEVTRGQFRQFTQESGYKAAANCSVFTGARSERVATKSWEDTNFPQTDAHPVSCITWLDAKTYVAWIAAKTGKSYRLLTEAEWEFAARAGSAGKYSYGEDANELCAYGNIADDTARAAGGLATWTYSQCQDGFGLGTAPVGTFKPNAFGLHDMHGNVWEWVEDCARDTYQGAPVDGSAYVTPDCPARVDRGGAFYNNRGTNRSAERAFYPPTGNSGNIGFRLARNL